jgi:glycosyltransferase involved in cell wall biosynthesis
MDQMKVLSLAWKYHPAITSGVGVACEGLNNALSRLAELTVIYPNVSSVRVDEEVILSADDLTEEQIKVIAEEYVKIQEDGSFELPLRLDPYFVSNSKSSRSSVSHIKQDRIKKKTIQKLKRKEVKVIKTTEKLLYDDVDIFGERVSEKIYLYNRLVEELAGNIQFDIIHAHDWMTFLAGIHLKDRFQKPLVLHVHSLEYDRVGHKDVAWVYDIERYAMSKADVVIAGSEYTKGIIESNYGLSGNRIKVVYNALTPSEIVKPDYDGFKGNFKVLFAGRIDGNKGIEYFVSIARAVLKKSKNVDFVVVGRGKRDVDFSKINGFNEVKKNFHYLGFVEREELFGLYQTCDVLCMPSISEPFGLTAIEAAHIGLPVILSSRTGAAEILSNTLTADFWDIEKFSSYILSLRNNNKLRKRIIEYNKLSVADLSWDNSAKRVMNIYEGL